ncbi:sulfatases signature 1 [Lucifera butyrica]|uniref:Sulfatases signature 1 n=1 Tax=Lucifera butyrica TaxID=1351585 RepID=A0A498R4S7_9FIRM|nr:sulfatase [Lucifera butyrica]VBB07696.1 sulfatases signature 1 [Lucifera butyrica]
MDTTKMNILYLHTHDTGRMISAYGYGIPTPNYQRLCDDAVLFQNAFSVAPTCSPSRAGLLTGVFPHQNGMLGLAQRGFSIRQDWHLANLLRQNGYHTALCGVQHEIGYYTDHAMAIGTLGYIEDLSANHTQYSEEKLVCWDKDNADNLSRWLDGYDRGEPFFVSYGMHATHRKYPAEIAEGISIDNSQPPPNVPNNEVMRKDFAQYKTSAKLADDNVGKVIDALKRNNLYDKTIIVLTTDHGLAYPFAKCTLNDSGIGVLLSMRVPGSRYGKNSYDGLISHIDVIPTLCELVAIKMPEYLEGKSFAGLFAGKECEGDEVIFGEINFHTSYEPVRAVRSRRFKYIRYFDEDYLKVNYSNIDNSPVKEFYQEHGLSKVTKESECLYDLYYDPFEKNNLARNPEYRQELEHMRRELYGFMVRTKDPLLEGPIEIRKEWKVNKKETYSPNSKDADDYESLGN